MRVILGVTGCIGAYKAVVILRLLQKAGHEVFPVMTRHARHFIGPVTLEKLSGHAVVTGLFDTQGGSIEHITLARKSNLLLVAPATANMLGKFAHGVADDFLTTLYLSTTTPVLVAPAMNVEMWRHPATQENVDILQRRGVRVIQPGSGYLACGEEGEGRMAEPEEVLQEAIGLLEGKKSLAGEVVLVTAGPTWEPIDPVRFLSNRSSGKMGFAVAAETRRRGARVILVSGPTQLPPPAGVELVPVSTAAEMAQTVAQYFPQVGIIIMAAAVTDFTPAVPAPQKAKKENGFPVVDWRPTVDVLKVLASRKRHQILVGFAAESENLYENARRKLRQKELDLIVANDISQPDRGFQSDQNQVMLIFADGSQKEFPLLPKSRVAGILLDEVERILAHRRAEAAQTGTGYETQDAR